METNDVLWESKSAEGGNEDAHIWKPLELKPPGQEGVKVDLALEERDLDVEEGDVEVQPPEELRDARGVTNTIRPWPNAIVPYEIVTSALRNIEDNTCVKFKKRAGEARYLLIKSGSGGCWTSSLGYPSYDKKVTINLGKGCVKPGRIRHEIFHSLGFPHEHARPDRDQYIIIKWNNIKDGASSQFKVDNRFPTLQVPYDVKSIMHYGKFAFTKVIIGALRNLFLDHMMP
ncbi:Astacin-like metalloprotease toxin 2-like [Homarus americanus]|uniref:Metalloendopeptidase n=1 Tax=Homarus americanus TaxID=6706 RepID=A0A8J5NBB6_HOMAM|nr:Astacin-like metalloprotease toxin 2-like [Homarus americanus]